MLIFIIGAHVSAQKVSQYYSSNLQKAKQYCIADKSYE